MMAETPGRLAILLIFFVLHLLSGAVLRRGRARLPLLWTLIEVTGRDIERRLNREGRSASQLFARGVITAMVIVFCAGFFGYAVELAGGYAYGWLAELALLFFAVTVMGPLAVLRHLEKDGLQQAATQIEVFLKEPLGKPDLHTILRKALEMSAISLTRHLGAPVFWYVIAGPLGMAVYVAVASLHRVVGLSDSRHRHFGALVRFADSLLTFVPGALVSFFVVFGSCFVSKSSPLQAFVMIMNQSRHFRPLCEGMPVAAMAGGLGVTLGGPVRHSSDYVIERRWIGPKETTARLTLGDLKHGEMLHFVVFLALMLVISALLIAPIFN